MKIEVPTPSRIVHYTLRTALDTLVTRPAIVVSVLEGSLLLNLQVFTEGDLDGLRNDGMSTSAAYRAHNVLCKAVVPYNAKGRENSWRWPERVAPVFIEVPE